jgi:hypothetical protein
MRMGMALLAFLTFLWTILAICFWIAHCEWPPCWTQASGSTWADVNSTYSYTKYDISFILACVACGLAMLMTLTAYWSVGATPAAPKDVEYSVPEPPLYPVVELPVAESYVTAPAYAYPATTTAYSTSYGAPVASAPVASAPMTYSAALSSYPANTTTMFGSAWPSTTTTGIAPTTSYSYSSYAPATSYSYAPATSSSYAPHTSSSYAPATSYAPMTSYGPTAYSNAPTTFPSTKYFY